MITDVILPALYIVELEGEAANLDFLLGQNFGIERIVFGSLDYHSDLSATIAGKQALEFFLDNPKLDADNVVETLSHNPDFFPSIEKIKVSPEREQAELDLIERYEKEANDGSKPVIVTKRFDAMGDYVTTRLELKSSNFTASLKVATNPELYIRQKTADEELLVNKMTSAHREINNEIKFH